jgi:hypothetical protein
MILAMKVRNVGIAIGSQSDYKSTLLLIAFPTIWLISLSVLGAWDSDIFENRNLAYQRLISSSAITFLIFCSASYIFKISISRFVILFSLIGGTLLHLCLRWVFFVTTSRNNKDETNASWIIVGKDPEKEVILRKLASQYNAFIYCINSFESQSSFEVWLLQILDSAKKEKRRKYLRANFQYPHFPAVASSNLGLGKSRHKCLYSKSDWNCSLAKHQRLYGK